MCIDYDYERIDVAFNLIVYSVNYKDGRVVNKES